MTSTPPRDVRQAEGNGDVTAEEGTAPATQRSGVQAIDRAAAILRCFGPHTPELGISEIARLTGLSTSTAHRLLGAMQQNRLVRQTAHRRYALGPLIPQLARDVEVPTALRDLALPVMYQLRDQVDETAGLHELLPSWQRVVIDQVESRQPLRRTYTEIGEPIPLPYGAPGKAMLAFVPYRVQVEQLGRPLSPVTPTTVTDPGTLRGQLDAIRAERVALSFSERTPGIRTVASPIFDGTGRVVGCLSLSGPEMRMPPERMYELSPQVSAAAWSVSEALGATEETLAECRANAEPPAR